MNLQIAKYFGIPLYLNLLTLPFALFIYLSNEDLGTFAVAIYIFALSFVVLHEYGHCYIANKCGWKIADITILPIGGVAKIHFLHAKPRQEIAVALAGPAVSLILAIIFFISACGTFYLDNMRLGFVFMVMFLSNAMIFTFNLLPVFPMDGGRVLRATLAIWLGHERATWWAVRLSQIAAFGLSILAFTNGYIVAGIIFALMIVLGQNELAGAKLLASLHRVRRNIALKLNKPELDLADLPTLIAAIEDVEDEELSKELNKGELLHLLRDLNQSKISI